MVEVEARAPDVGEVLVENVFMSVDPYMRGRMREAWGPGDVLEGGAIGRILESGFDGLQAGDFVLQVLHTVGNHCLFVGS